MVQDIENNNSEDVTGFSSTLGILVAANNKHCRHQEVIDLIWDFTLDAEGRDEVVSSSSMVNTMGKIIMIDGDALIAPTSEDVLIRRTGRPVSTAPTRMSPA